jgi:hypothetical protein
VNKRDLKADLELCSRARDIPGLHGYKADEHGAIWSAQHNWRGYGPQIMATSTCKDGYLTVRLTTKGKRKKYRVHRLVCMAFNGLPESGQVVRHLNGDKIDNRPGNLKWGTHKENEADAVRMGEKATGERNGAVKYSERVAAGVKKWLRENPERIKRGESHYAALLTNKQAEELQKRHRVGERVCDLAREFNLNYYTAYAICKGRRYRRCGKGCVV